MEYNRCHRKYKHPGMYRKGQLTTTSLNRHLSECRQYKQKVNGNSSFDTSSNDSNIQNLFDRQHAKNYGESIEKPSEEDVKDAVLNYFISGNIAFNQADNPEFQRLINMTRVNGQPVIINRRNIRARLSVLAAKAREDFMQQLRTNNSKVSLALDCWTSSINHAYYNAHFVRYIMAY